MHFFCLYSFLVSLFHDNMLGMGQSLGLIIIVIINRFYRYNLNERLFTFIIDLCCFLSIFCFLYGLLFFV